MRQFSFILALLLGTLTLHAETFPSTQEHSSQEQIEKIDTELQNLQTELKNYRKAALNAEMQAQPDMFDNWQEYADHIRTNEEDEKKIKKIKEKINSLKEKRAELIKASSH